MTKMAPTALSGSVPPRTPVVVITGASSGIGRCTASAFARRGWNVALIARGQAGLAAAQREVQASGAGKAITVTTASADVSDPAALEAAAAAIETVLGTADLWINCAGNGTFGRFLDTSPEEFKRVTDVTYLGSVNGTRVALSRMLPRDSGHIINVCSAVAFHGMPLLSSYSGAKHAIRGFGQAVRAELAQDKRRVRITTVFPPAVNTPFFDHAISHMGALGRPMSPVYQPDVIAEAIYLAAMSKRPELLISFTTVLFAAAVRLMPGVVARAIRRLGYEGQLTDDQAARARHNPTLFSASDTASSARGAFDSISRSRSVQVSIMRWFARRAIRGSTAGTTAVAPQTEQQTGAQAGMHSAKQPDAETNAGTSVIRRRQTPANIVPRAARDYATETLQSGEDAIRPPASAQSTRA